MQILVTGASSLLGQSLLRGLVDRELLTGIDGPARIRRILAVDRAQGPSLFVDDRVEYVCGAYEQSRFLARVMGTATEGIFHLVALESGTHEEQDDPVADLDDDLTSTWDGTRALLDACRFQIAQPKLVVASTVEAAGDVGCTVGCTVDCAAPRSRVGALVAMCELLVAEGARRRIVRSCCLRFGPLADDRALDDAVTALISAYERMR